MLKVGALRGAMLKGGGGGVNNTVVLRMRPGVAGNAGRRLLLIHVFTDLVLLYEITTSRVTATNSSDDRSASDNKARF